MATNTREKREKRPIEEASEATGKVSRATYDVHRKVRTAEVLTSGNPRLITKYYIRRWAYRVFARFMNKTVNRI
ncbi:MAG TPA: hypothetical protein VHR15_21200 [Ktedonobacterales bacterium]|jgi:hypothetical protein|nr:hypothetical protein [Ktedonobacterales bacterium]